MPAQWYFEHDGRPQGPFLLSQLKKLAALGRLRPTDFVWQEDQSRKISASELKGIFSNSPPLPKTQSRSPVVPPPLPTTSNSPPPLPDDANLPHGIRMPELPDIGDGVLPTFWRRHGFKIGVLAVVACVFLVAVAGHLDATKNGSQPTTNGDAFQNVSATDLYAAFQSDPEAADKRFKGKWLAVSGQIGTRDNAPKNHRGTILMGLKGSDATDAYVACYFARENESMLQLLDATPQPPIIGKCLGIAQSEYAKDGQSLIEVQLQECNIRSVTSAQLPEKQPVIARKMTKKQFLEKLKQSMPPDGRMEPGFVYAVFRNNSFQQAFGDPDSNMAHVDSTRMISYRCKDGIIAMVVHFIGPTVVLEEVNQF